MVRTMTPIVDDDIELPSWRLRRERLEVAHAALIDHESRDPIIINIYKFINLVHRY